VAPETRQAGQQMLQLRQFNLQLAFASASPLSENVQDQRGPIQHLAVENFLQVAALSRRKLIVEDYGVDLRLLTVQREFVGFSLANKGAGAWSCQFLEAVTDYVASGGGGQFGKFVQRIPYVPPIAGFEFDAYEKYSFSPSVPGLDECFQISASSRSLSIRLICLTLPHRAQDKKRFLASTARAAALPFSKSIQNPSVRPIRSPGTNTPGQRHPSAAGLGERQLFFSRNLKFVIPWPQIRRSERVITYLVLAAPQAWVCQSVFQASFSKAFQQQNGICVVREHRFTAVRAVGDVFC
jgi:hypothetical protein